MTKSGLSWRNAQLPPRTAVFAIGDIHSNHESLDTLLKGIKNKIAQLPPDVQAHVVFIGDYIDRGSSAPETINKLLKFESEMAGRVIAESDESRSGSMIGRWVGWILGHKEPAKTRPKVITTFLCGNHDEYFKRMLETRVITDKMLGDPNNPNDLRHCITDTDGTMTLTGLQAFFGGGVITTIKNYVPSTDIDKDLFVYDDKGNEIGFNTRNSNLRAGLEKLLEKLAANVPQEHKDFLGHVYNNHHLILGDYLFTHAGVEPDKTLKAQGIDPDKTGTAQGIMPGVLEKEGKSYLDTVMIRNPFLWRDDDNLPNCPYIVVHGHTPSAIKYENDTIADGQKNYRLCIDTDVCKPDGALTCFIRDGDQAGFMAVSKNNPDKVHEYDIPIECQAYEAWVHKIKFPQYHSKAAAIAI